MTRVAMISQMSLLKCRPYLFGNIRFISSGAGARGLPEKTPVVIVGGGPTGLLLSNLLSLYGTPSILLESQTPQERFAHPQAHFLNTRTMEILRHSLPDVYKEIWKKVPPVKYWNHFQWGSSMMVGLARVRHPVDRPLQANLDGNGRLQVNRDSNEELVEEERSTNYHLDLSACSVAHLAQHHFCRILYKAAKRNAETCSSIVEYGTLVTQVTTDDKDAEFPVSVTTAQGDSIRTKVVVAVDGSNSMLRKAWKIGLQGQAMLQNLINVHIKIHNLELSRKLHTNKNAAMLHFIYNPAVVAVVVCHSVGEYVLQIPFFPPFQTLDADFSTEKVRSMVQAVLGLPSNAEARDDEVEVVSIRPWTMSSLIAERYISGNHFVLAGDSAHMFPPAGGLGMNTGLQDVHNLAWRLSWLYDKNTHYNTVTRHEKTGEVLQRYEKERRPVARQNAALSVRNYNRTLQLAKGCYLNDQHPMALTAMLSSPPFSLLPLETRQKTFQTLVQTAMWPLGALQDSTSMHGQRIQRNVRNILERGEGLPLLFPRFELGFRYVDGEESLDTTANGGDWASDTAGFSPQVRVGCLFPHARVQVATPHYSLLMDQYPHIIPLDEESNDGDVVQLTTTDLPAQLRQGPVFGDLKQSTSSLAPGFVVVLLNCDTSVVEYLETRISKLGVHIHVAVIINADEEAGQQSHRLTLFDTHSILRPMLRPFENKPVLVLVRPDGHVASVVVLKAISAANNGEGVTKRHEGSDAIQCPLASALDCLTADVQQSLGTGIA